MIENTVNTFEELKTVNINNRLKDKLGLKYLSWAHAWEVIKSLYPNAIRTIYHRTITTETTKSLTLSDGTVETTKTSFINEVPYFTDGKTCFVRVGVTINGIEYIEEYPVMNLKNASVRVESVTSVDVNKAIQRAFVKACAWHGLGLYVYAGEDLPENERVVIDYNALQDEAATSITDNLTEEDFNTMKQNVIDMVRSENPNSETEAAIVQYTTTLFPNKRLSLLTYGEDCANLQKLYAFLNKLKGLKSE